MAFRRVRGTLLLGSALALHAQDTTTAPLSGSSNATTVALASDTLLHPTWVSQGVSLQVHHEFDRTVVRPGLAWQDSVGGSLVEILDTSCLVKNPSPDRLDADHGLHAAVSRNLFSGTGVFSWEQIAQVEGQFADAGSLGGSHTRGRVLGGWNRPMDGFRFGGWGGVLWEYDDPSAGSLSLVQGGLPHRGPQATSLGAVEGGWSSTEGQRTSEIAGHLQRDAGNDSLREESSSLRGLWTSGDLPIGAFAAEGRIDAIRRRSEVLGQDRDIVRREVAGNWKREAFGQELSLRSGWSDTLALDYTGRVPGQDAWGISEGGGVMGDLGGGFFHKQDLSWARADRKVLDDLGDQGVLEKSQSSREQLLRLADTLGWRTERFGFLRIQAGWVRWLDQLRHPDNPAQGPADRPDQDVSETGVGFSVRDSLLSRDDKPLFSWTWQQTDEVYLHAVRSAETRRREGNRLSSDVGFLPVERVRLELGTVAREQRTTWRFDTTRNEGLMEWQWDAAMQEGPTARPNLRAWVEERLTWNGALLGEDFAVERRTVLWKPGAKLWWRPRAGWSLSPWVERWIESSMTWDGASLAADPDQTQWRIALDGDAEFKSAKAHLSCVRVLADPGNDDWRIEGEGRWTW